MCSTSALVGLGRAGALATDGRSKPFSASADGFGVAEGAGMLVLTRLSTARARDYPVVALIRGTGTRIGDQIEVEQAPPGQVPVRTEAAHRR